MQKILFAQRKAIKAKASSTGDANCSCIEQMQAFVDANPADASWSNIIVTRAASVIMKAHLQRSEYTAFCSQGSLGRAQEEEEEEERRKRRRRRKRRGKRRRKRRSRKRSRSRMRKFFCGWPAFGCFRCLAM